MILPISLIEMCLSEVWAISRDYSAEEKRVGNIKASHDSENLSRVFSGWLGLDEAVKGRKSSTSWQIPECPQASCMFIGWSNFYG